MSDVHPDELAFLAKIAEHPDYALPRLVFADWLEERGDRRAAWVRDDDLWEWMKPDAGDPIPGILAALPARRRLDPTDWSRQPDAQARKALLQLEPEAVDSIRNWLLAHPEHYPDKIVQEVVLVRRPAKLRSVRALKSKLKSDSWVEMWLAVVDLSFHGPAASSAVTALMKIDSYDRWPTLMEAVEKDERPVENAINRTLGRIGSGSPKVVPWLADIL